MPLHLRVVPREGPILDDARPLPYKIVWMHETGDSWEVGAFALSDFDLLQLAFPSRVPQISSYPDLFQAQDCDGKLLISRLSGKPIYQYGFSEVLKSVVRDYQPTWRIRSRMSPL